MTVRAFGFDVFGTVVDWRTSVAREARGFLDAIGRGDIDPFDFADRWRARYLPAMKAVRDGTRAWVVLDVLHREILCDLLAELGVRVEAIDAHLIDDMAMAWHRLDPWPDARAGLARLRCRYPVVTLSNGNVALMVDLARHAGIAWDAILGAEHARSYKPDPAVYRATAAALGIAAHELCLVAAHHADLAAARACGLLTAYVDRPMEYGGRPAPDADQRQDWDWSAASITDLADQLGCPA